MISCFISTSRSLADPFNARAGSPYLIKTDFFQNSTRHNPDPESNITKAMVRIGFGKSHCSGFFVTNSDHRLFVATARHCADYHFAEACRDGKLKVETFAGKFRGTCSAVIASDDDHDAVIFEAEFANPADQVVEKIRFLDLSTKGAPAGTRLKMFGYPGDAYRNGTLTVTENCWANKGRDSRRYLTVGEASISQEFSASQESDDWTTRIRNKENMVAYNCDVYGGNSGGPVLNEDTLDVIGMPATYVMNVYRKLPWQASAWFFTLDRFIQTNAASLEAAGIFWK